MDLAIDDTAKPARTRGRPRLAEVDDIENALLGAALEEFVAHGYGGASMNRIVRTAKISKTTLYSRFPSKEALFRAIMQKQMDRLAQAATLTAQDGRLDLAAGLKAYGYQALDASFEGGLLEVNRLIYSESHRFPELAMAAHERSEVGIREISDFISRCAIADGIPCNKPRIAAEVFIFMLRGWYVDVLLVNKVTSPKGQKYWVDAAVDAFVAGRRGW